MRRYYWVSLLSGLILVLIAAAFVLLVQTRGIRVSVKNLGPEPLADVSVCVTGHSYELSGLRVGEVQAVTVKPRGESHVELEVVDSHGKRSRLDAGGYFEPGYQGSIDIDLEGGSIKRNEQCIRVGP